ncbi:hypothetical protein KC345_g261 [Hortaea werneckii]|nr:hypothetical protein KC345_g261 [Hortaea werneckii]
MSSFRALRPLAPLLLLAICLASATTDSNRDSSVWPKSRIRTERGTPGIPSVPKALSNVDFPTLRSLITICQATLVNRVWRSLGWSGSLLSQRRGRLQRLCGNGFAVP